VGHHPVLSTRCAHPRIDCFAGFSAPLGPTPTTKVHKTLTSTLPLKRNALTAKARRGNMGSHHEYTPSQLCVGSPRHTPTHNPPSTLWAHSTTTVHAMQFSEACERPGTQHTKHNPTSMRCDAHASPEPHVGSRPSTRGIWHWRQRRVSTAQLVHHGRDRSHVPIHSATAPIDIFPAGFT